MGQHSFAPTSRSVNSTIIKDSYPRHFRYPPSCIAYVTVFAFLAIAVGEVEDELSELTITALTCATFPYSGYLDHASVSGYTLDSCRCPDATFFFLTPLDKSIT